MQQSQTTISTPKYKEKCGRITEIQTFANHTSKLKIHVGLSSEKGSYWGFLSQSRSIRCTGSSSRESATRFVGAEKDVHRGIFEKPFSSFCCTKVEQINDAKFYRRIYSPPPSYHADCGLKIFHSPLSKPTQRNQTWIRAESRTHIPLTSVILKTCLRWEFPANASESCRDSSAELDRFSARSKLLQNNRMHPSAGMGPS